MCQYCRASREERQTRLSQHLHCVSFSTAVGRNESHWLDTHTHTYRKRGPSVRLTAALATKVTGLGCWQFYRPSTSSALRCCCHTEHAHALGPSDSLALVCGDTRAREEPGRGERERKEKIRAIENAAGRMRLIVCCDAIKLSLLRE